MAKDVDGKGVAVSVKIYGRLLAIYPADFRREYGPSMTQVFRDQCRDAWTRAQSRGLAVLWLRVLLDLAKTSLVEYVTYLHRRESMCRKMLRAFRVFRADAGLRTAFFRVFAFAFVCALALSLGQMFWTPRVYSSRTLIEVQKNAPVLPAREYKGDISAFMATQLKIITSYTVLTNVITSLRLNYRLAAQAGEAPWTIDQTYAALFNKIVVRQPRPPPYPTEISVENPEPELAANIANAIVDAYRESRVEKSTEESETLITESQTHLNDEETKLRIMESNLNALRTSLGISNLDQQSLKESAATETEQLQKYQHIATTALSDCLEYSNILGGIANIPKYEVGKILATAFPLQSGEMAALSARLDAAREKWALAQSELDTKNPEYAATQKQLRDAQDDYDNKVKSIIAGFKERVAIDRESIRMAEQLKKDLETKRDQIAIKSQAYFSLKRNIDKLKSDIEALNRTVWGEMAEFSLVNNPVIVRDPARPVLHPIQSMSEIFSKWMLGGTLAALAAGVTGAWLVHLIRRSSDRLHTPS